jgi:hypothetical protein
MLEWLKARKKNKVLPEYSALRRVPTRQLPPDLSAQENSTSHTARRQTIEEELRISPRRPSETEPLFVELRLARGSGAMTITLPDNAGQCLPVFTSTFRASDYVRVHLLSGPALRYLSTSPEQLARLIRSGGMVGLKKFTLDCCPRCMIFSAVDTSSRITAENLVELWCVLKATEFARADLYFSYALEAARRGQVEAALNVALECVGHVTAEDPRLHLLLGQLAVKFNFNELLREARAFLDYLSADSWTTVLDQVVQSGLPDFEGFPRER